MLLNEFQGLFTDILAIILGMDLTEGEKTVFLGAIINKGRLQVRLYGHNSGLVDIAFCMFPGNR